LVLCLGLGAALLLFYLYYIKPLVSLPADILMWAETGFVGDIIKLRTGVPIYTPPQDSNAMIYTPGAPILTYALSVLMGQTTSIVAWRVIQLGYVAGAALLATVCVSWLYNLAYPGRRMPFRMTWLAFAFISLFLVATTPRTNPFVHALHGDALGLLISVFSFWTMTLYMKSPGWKRVLVMAMCPALGYLVKQYLVSWAAVMFVFLLLHEQRNWRHLVLFAVAAALFVGGAVGMCYLLWGDAFVFWTLTIMRGHSGITLAFDTEMLSVTRSVEHLARLWPEIAIGVAGGWLILGERNLRRLGPLWAAWVVLIASEAFSSGAGWSVLYHFGPGILIGAIWLLAALPHIWPYRRPAQNTESPGLAHGMRVLAAMAGVLAAFSVLSVVPSGDAYGPRYWRGQIDSGDAERYIAEIESEFEGLPVSEVLLDIGNWVYLRSSFLAKDRAVSLGDQPPAGIYENMDVLVGRIQNHAYAKILVHDLHKPNFHYDWASWKRSSGVKSALLTYYKEVRIIPAMRGGPLLLHQVMHGGPVSVLVPR
jgi:hypothetical protein